MSNQAENITETVGQVHSLVISVRQPWAWLIINGGKDIENREWFTNVRGRVLIHAAQSVKKRDWLKAWEYVRLICPEAWEKGKVEIQAGMIERGGVIGSVEIVDCVESSTSPWFVGRYGFVLRDPKPLPFHPSKGTLGFFSSERIGL